jgi:hypothetical protein
VNGNPQGVTGKVEDRNMKTLKITGLLMAALLVMTLPVNAHVRFGGGFAFVPSIGAWYYPYLGPYGLYGPYPVHQGIYSVAGEIRLKTNVKDADVFINGAYAGKAAKLKSIWLRPDTYNLEIRASGYASYSERIYVMAGKTMHIDAQLASVPRS